MALQPMYGKIYTYFNTKRVFLVALFIFELGSTICAAAPSSTVFIVGRALSGSGAAGILSGALTLGAHLVPLVKRPLYMSIIMSMYGVAAVAGPTLGGVFTDSERLTWRFCFWLNLRMQKRLADWKETELTTGSIRWLGCSYLCHTPRAIYGTTGLGSFSESKAEQIGFSGRHTISTYRRTFTTSLEMGRVGLCLELSPSVRLLGRLCRLPHNLHDYSSSTKAKVRPKLPE